MPDLPEFAPRFRRALHGIADTATQIVLDQRKRLYDAEVQHQYSKGVYEMDLKFNQFMVDAQGRQDYMNLDKDWDQYQKETYSKITADFTLPEAQQAFEKNYLNDEPKRRFYVAQQARTKQIKATVADDSRSLKFYVDTVNSEGAKRQIESMRATGIYPKADLQKMEDETYHEITGGGYRAYADIIALQNPSEDGVDAAAEWMIDNTPEWEDGERLQEINSFKAAWKIRLGGMQGQKEKQILKEWIAAQDELKTATDNSQIVNITMKSLNEKYPNLPAEKLTAVYNGYLKAADEKLEETRLSDVTGARVKVQASVENRNFGAAESAVAASKMNAKERAAELVLIEKAKGTEAFGKDYVAASKVVTGFREGTIAEVDPQSFYNTAAYPALGKDAEHFANEIAAEKDRRKAKSEDPLTSSDPGIELQAFLMARGPYSEIAKLDWIKNHTGPDVNGRRQLSPASARQLESDAKAYSPNTMRDTSIKFITDYYAGAMKDKDRNSKEYAELQQEQLSDLRRLDQEIAKPAGNPDEAAANIVKFRRESTGSKNIQEILKKMEGGLLGLERWAGAAAPGMFVAPAPSGVVTGFGPMPGAIPEPRFAAQTKHTRDGREWHPDVVNGKTVWRHRPSGETRPR